MPMTYVSGELDEVSSAHEVDETCLLLLWTESTKRALQKDDSCTQIPKYISKL